MITFYYCIIVVIIVIKNYVIQILIFIPCVFSFLTYQIFCIRQILEKKLEYNETVGTSAIHRIQESL
jgi:hypothetical protein